MRPSRSETSLKRIWFTVFPLGGKDEATNLRHLNAIIAANLCQNMHSPSPGELSDLVANFLKFGIAGEM